MVSLEAVSAIVSSRGESEKAMPKAAEIDERRGLRDTSQIKVLVADDHAMVREGIAEMLSLNEDIEIVGQAGDGREAIELAKETRPDVVILDVEMPVMGAQAALRRLLELSPPPKVNYRHRVRQPTPGA